MSIAQPSAAEIGAAFEIVAGRPGDAVDSALRSPRTIVEYAGRVRLFEAWLARRNLVLPVGADVVCAWLKELALAGRRPATIRAYASAVVVALQHRGAPIEWRALRETLRRIARLNNAEPRKARPILRDELKAIAAELSATRAIDLRDAALMTLMFSAKLRQSEAISLDWHRLGSGRGYVRRHEGALELVLVRSKTSQAMPARIRVGAKFMPAAIAALDAWAKCAQLKPGAPVFTSVHRDTVSSSRLHPQDVCRVLKQRVREHYLAAGSSVEEAEDFARATSGHSLRRGGITAEVIGGLREASIRRRSRHASASMVAAYVEDAAVDDDQLLERVGF